MYEIATEIEIAAAPEAVWSVLTDFPAHSHWNPFIRSIEGNADPGERLRVAIQPIGGKAMTFRPTVLAAEQPRELRWRGRLILPGLFDGEHYFQLLPLGAGRIRFIQGERFSGLLVPLMKRALDTGTRAGFIAMNEAIKARVEHRS
jgi:hypothetical protein